MKSKLLKTFCLLPLLAAMAVSAHAQGMEPTVSPSQSPYGVLGMSNVTSSEAMGPGVMNLNLHTTFYKQAPAVPGVLANTQITSVSGGAALGVNHYMDVFVGMNIYNFNASGTGNNHSGFGSLALGAKGALPASEDSHFRMGLQMAGIFGTGNNPFNTHRADGYNYLQMRSNGDNDLLVRVTQSFLMTNPDKGGVGVNIHLNEGVVSSFEAGKGVLVVTGAGLEVIPAAPLILGVEINSRTQMSDVQTSDPLWVTPSVTWRTPKFVNVNLGVDVSISTDRDAGQPRALEPWRVFGGISGSLDTQRGNRAAKAAQEREAREAAARARRDSVENVALHRAYNDADKRADSLARVNAASNANKKGTSDSLSALTNKSKQDSIAMANKAKQDSLALAESARKLALEKSKRSDAEKQLLSTGLLLMDAVYFETGKTEISINSKPYLNIIAKMLVKYPKLNIEVSGHTDNVGGVDYNMNLSQGRSQSVRDYMVTVAPELNNHLSAKGYGLSQPKATNGTVKGRTLNRRTELQVLNKDALSEYNR
jgi:outer membrane protein OmpA-like peptidoglycan-associated protein